MAMTPAQKRAAVLTAAQNLVDNPHCWDPTIAYGVWPYPAVSADPRCLYAHVAGTGDGKYARLKAAGWTDLEYHELQAVDRDCTSAAEMYERAVKLCDRLWPHRPFLETPLPRSPREIILTNITAGDPPEQPQGTTAFERLERDLAEAGPVSTSVKTTDLRAAVEYLRCWSTAPHRADSPGHALFEVRS